MTTTTSKKNEITSTLNNKDNSNPSNNKMTSCSIKINFQGASREVDLPTPATLSALQAAVSSTFKVELAARSDEDSGGADTDLSFTYKDSDGDDIVFDKDSELALALRLCPSPLEICAVNKQKDKKKVRGDTLLRDSRFFNTGS